MNKLIIGLLIIAAGAGVFFFLNKKKNKPVDKTFNKELIIGKWKTYSAEALKDSMQTSHLYEFQKEGLVLHSLNDSSNVDTTHYEWGKANELIWNQSGADSIGKVFSIQSLTKDSLQLQAKDSTVSLFIKAE